jgi:hypothetical protein
MLRFISRWAKFTCGLAIIGGEIWFIAENITIQVAFGFSLCVAVALLFLTCGAIGLIVDAVKEGK